VRFYSDQFELSRFGNKRKNVRKYLGEGGVTKGNNIIVEKLTLTNRLVKISVLV